MISALRGRCPGPLDECGAETAGCWGNPTRGQVYQPPDKGRQVELKAMRLDEGAHCIGDLLVAVLADDAGRSANACQSPRTRRPATLPGAALSLSGKKRSRPAPMTSLGTCGSWSSSIETPSSICRRAAPDSAPIMCWTRITSALVRVRVLALERVDRPIPAQQLAPVFARQQPDHVWRWRRQRALRAAPARTARGPRSAAPAPGAAPAGRPSRGPARSAAAAGGRPRQQRRPCTVEKSSSPKSAVSDQ